MNKKIVDVHSGAFHVVILNSAGELYTGGDCLSGRLCREVDQRFYGFEKVESQYIYTAIRCTNDATITGTIDGEVLVYGSLVGKDYLGTKLCKLGAKVCSICPSTSSKQVLVTTEDKNLFVCSLNDQYHKLPQTGDYLVGSIEYANESYWYLLPRGENVIEKHFCLMQRAYRKFNDLTVKFC
jgi:hypothetical protein